MLCASSPAFLTLPKLVAKDQTLLTVKVSFGSCPQENSVGSGPIFGDSCKECRGLGRLIASCLCCVGHGCAGANCYSHL